MAIRGRPQTYSDDQIAAVVELMGSEGISLKAASKKSGIDYSTVSKRIDESRDLSRLYTRQVEEYARVKVDKMTEIAETVEDVARARLMCDNIKWETQRVCRRLYGDKVEHTGDGGGPLVVEIVQFGGDKNK